MLAVKCYCLSIKIIKSIQLSTSYPYSYEVIFVHRKEQQNISFTVLFTDYTLITLITINIILLIRLFNAEIIYELGC